MSDFNSNELESIRKRWDDCASTYDEWSETFQGAVGQRVDWELLKKYLPEDRSAKIFDAAGGTGRMTLPLAQMGYSVTLCDLSPGMLAVARQKLLREGVIDKVTILECDINDLAFSNERFDFVLCWDGYWAAHEGIREVIRVTKKGGRISISPISRWAAAIRNFYKDPDSALALIGSQPSYLEDKYGKHWAVSPEEVRELFKTEGVRILDIYAPWGWMEVLGVPEKVRKSREWEEKFFEQTTEMVLRLSKEPSVKGLSSYLVYGEKI